MPAADFEVEIKNDGTVHVTENWEVSYTRGDFTRFYKDIYRTVPTEETFNLDEDSMKVSIDGKECAPAYNTTDRENYTFYLEKSFEEYTVHCFLASSHVNRKYQISYTIKDAVKIVDGEYYLVTFRMIGANFPKTVRHVSALYTAPEGSTVEVRNGQYFDKVVSEGNTVRVEDEYWDGVFKVKVRIDHASIANAVALTMLSHLPETSSVMLTITGKRSRAGKDLNGWKLSRSFWDYWLCYWLCAFPLASSC